jgi:hypothetical protein
MGRMVWFGPPLLAAGFGVPAVAVVALGAAALGAVYWLGRRARPKGHEHEQARA